MKNHKGFRWLVILIIVLGLLSIAFVCLRKYLPTSERMSADLYFGFAADSSELSADEDGGTVAAVVYEDHVAQERALIMDGNVYIDYTLVQSELNSRFYWDASEGVMLFTTAEQLFEIGVDTPLYTIDEESFDAGYEIVKSTSSGLFVSMTFLQQYTDINYEVYESPTRVVITKGSEQVTTAEVKKDTVVRYRGGIKSPILTDVIVGDKVRVLEQMENWSQIVTADGYIGYIRNTSLMNLEETMRETYYQDWYSNIYLDERVNMVWHQIDYAGMNADLSEAIEAADGVNVISPTWYYLSDNSGGILSFADASYVETAHEAGLQVWPLISNFNSEISTSTILATRKARQEIENFLIDQALTLGFEGINIDFEGIVQEAGYDYVQFLRELSILCRKNEIILSVDVPVPYDFNKYYNFSELGTVCDYVIMMGYDEHYAGSAAGSVASLEFEENGIVNLLKDVPKEKIISGIPFYSRIWYTETLSDGTGSVTSEIVSMDETQQLLSDLGLSASYDADTGQHYVQWNTDDGILCQIWIEDDFSAAARAGLVSKYDLGGIAAWRLGNESAGVWETIAGQIS